MPPVCRYDLEAETRLQVYDAAAQGCLRLAEVGGRDDVGDSGWIEVKVVKRLKASARISNFASSPRIGILGRPKAFVTVASTSR
jgi:hypothetical protein